MISFSALRGGSSPWPFSSWCYPYPYPYPPTLAQTLTLALALLIVVLPLPLPIPANPSPNPNSSPGASHRGATLPLPIPINPSPNPNSGPGLSPNPSLTPALALTLTLGADGRGGDQREELLLQRLLHARMREGVSSSRVSFNDCYMV
jgi:hypothetical protein